MAIMKSAASRFADSRGKHDHRRCVSKALRTADEVCTERGPEIDPHPQARARAHLDAPCAHRGLRQS